MISVVSIVATAMSLADSHMSEACQCQSLDLNKEEKQNVL